MSICNFKIDNLRVTVNGGYRGCSLSSKRNQWALPKFFEAGITTIIDLRTTDHTARFRSQCEHVGFAYYHFPIDSKNISNETIIDFLPELIRVIDEGNFYIACAMGLDRTDIALALYYLFNVKATTPIPELAGHKQNNGDLRYDDIFRRTNAICQAISNGLSEFEREYKRRKKVLVEYNSHPRHNDKEDVTKI